MTDLKYADILRLNRELKNKLHGDAYRAAVLSNVTIDQFKDIFEYALRSRGVNADIHIGAYDNILQDSIQLSPQNLYIICWELANITEGFYYRSEIMDEKVLRDLVDSMKRSIDTLFSNLKTAPMIIMNRFSALPFAHADLRLTRYDAVAQALNEHLESRAPAHCVLVDLNKIYSKLSLEVSVDFRNFYSSQALYSMPFLKAYAASIAPIPLSIMGRTKKALIFDCDNTLWNGTVGEDGVEGLEVTPPFQEVQHLALSLSKRGVLLGLCSKNDPEDVESALRDHPNMTLRQNDFTIKKINWTDKAANIEALARELNIAIDSLVMVEDSDFEVNLLRQRLPELTVIQVPKNISEYPALLREQESLFYTATRSAEDAQRGRMYHQEKQRQEDQKSFENIDDFLRSLHLHVTVHCDDEALISRLAQLTQKTNQFNLTTRRYTEADIAQFTGSKEHEVLALEINDVYGSYGIAGLCIIRCNNPAGEAELDSWLLSCRVLGRNIERAFFDFLVSRLEQRGIRSLKTVYRKTGKNSHVETLFETLGCTLLGAAEGVKTYQISLAQYRSSGIEYIDVQTA